MRLKKLISGILIGSMLLSSVCSFAMSTEDFDNGMAKGISYFNNGLYYEAKDEFQWFCDGNWGIMNDGQKKYALDYLGGAKQKIIEWENKTKPESIYSSLSSEDIRKLNVFLSNFSEAYLYDFDSNYYDEGEAVKFAFIHNLINNDSNIVYQGMEMGISLADVNSTLNKYFGVSVSPSTKYVYNSYYSGDRYYNYTVVWEYRNGMFWTSAASGETYDYFTIVNNLIDLKDGTYRAEFNVYYAGYDSISSDCYSYSDGTARLMCEHKCSGYAIINKKYYSGNNTWNLDKLVSY